MGNMDGKSTSYLLNNAFEFKHHASLGYCELVKDGISGVFGERYTCYVENFDREVAIYEFRSSNMEWVVGVWAVQKGDEHYMCSSGVTVRIVTERIPYRLMDLGHIGYSEGLYIMWKCLKGAELIWKKLGAIQFDQNMVCFNPKGEAKIWLHQNISLNSPKSQINFSEKELIASIMQIVESRMGGQKMNEYNQMKKKIDPSDFLTAIHFINSMKSQVNEVNCVVIPSMVAETFRLKQQEPEKTVEETPKNEYKLKIPTGLPPRPPKSRSQSHQKQKQKPKTPSTNAKLKLKQSYQSSRCEIRQENNTFEQKKMRVFSPQVRIINSRNGSLENKAKKSLKEKKYQVSFGESPVKKSQRNHIKTCKRSVFQESSPALIKNNQNIFFNGLKIDNSEQRPLINSPMLSSPATTPFLGTSLALERKTRTNTVAQVLATPKVNFTFTNISSSSKN